MAWEWHLNLSRWQQYFLAILLSVGTLAIFKLVPAYYYHRPLLVAFMPSIIISALLGGMAPGIVSTVIAALGVGYYFYEPLGNLSGKDVRDFIHLFLLVASGVLASGLSELLHRSRKALRAEQAALRESEARYRSLVEAAPVGVILQAADGKIITWNRKMEQLFGVAEEDLRGQDARGREWKTYRPDGSEWKASEHPSMVTLSTGLPCRDEVMRMVGSDGSEHWLSINTEPLFKEGDSTPGAVIIAVSDVTGSKREEQFREEVERIIRHDIRSPLINISSIIQLSKMDKLGCDITELLPQMEHGLQQALKLMDSTQKMQQMERNAYKPRRKPVVMAHLISYAADALLTLTKRRGVTILVRADNRPGEVQCTLQGEALLLEDMLLNLVKNAVEAAPRGGVVTIVHGFENGEQVVRIHNLGEVPKEIRKEFFTKNISAGKALGSGIGTYSAQLIARAHQGSVEVNTSVPGATTVTVRLPCLPPEGGES